jgi:hypothetical protein
MFAAQPLNYPQLGELLQVGKGVLWRTVSETVRPTSQRAFDLAQEVREWVVRSLLCQRLDLGHD